jgi:hypothetical protein
MKQLSFRIGVTFIAVSGILSSQLKQYEVSGQLTDPQSNAVTAADVTLTERTTARTWTAHPDRAGHFAFQVPALGSYTLKANAPAFQPVVRSIDVAANLTRLDVQLLSVAQRQETINVVADVREKSILFPDPAQRVYIRQETLDANPGRPGVPISIPGVPIETASGGIKAPQYFAPGVAGDHGESIAQYIQVGSYLLSNNLSSNAHGNGYADPNILIPATLEGSRPTAVRSTFAKAIMRKACQQSLTCAQGLSPLLRRPVTIATETSSSAGALKVRRRNRG